MQCEILDWILERKKNVSGKSAGIHIKSVVKSNVSVSVLLVLTTVPQLYKKLILGKAM